MSKILIVEDEPVLAKVLKSRFEDEGWSVDTAEDGEVGLASIKSNQYNVVLLDLILPKLDGFELLKQVKSEERFKNLPIVILSNLGADEDVKRAMSLGAADYFIKTQHPIKEVLERLEQYRNDKPATPTVS